jgi:hypothetical protein
MHSFLLVAKKLFRKAIVILAARATQADANAVFFQHIFIAAAAILATVVTMKYEV